MSIVSPAAPTITRTPIVQVVAAASRDVFHMFGAPGLSPAREPRGPEAPGRAPLP